MSDSEWMVLAVRSATETLAKECEDRDMEIKKQKDRGDFAGNTMGGRDRGRGGRGGRGRDRGGKQSSNDRESNSKQQNNSRGRGRGGKFQRSGHPPRENDDEGNGKICKFCNQECAAMKGGKKEQCYAWGKECKKCGKKGHYQSVCRMKDGVANVTSGRSGDGESEERAEGGRMSSGF